MIDFIVDSRAILALAGRSLSIILDSILRVSAIYTLSDG